MDWTGRARVHAQVNEQGSLFVIADGATIAPGKATVRLSDLNAGQADARGRRCCRIE